MPRRLWSVFLQKKGKMLMPNTETLGAAYSN